MPRDIDPLRPTVKIDMACERCGRRREVTFPADIIADGDFDNWKYICCRCYGVQNTLGVVWRQEPEQLANDEGG